MSRPYKQQLVIWIIFTICDMGILKVVFKEGFYEHRVCTFDGVRTAQIIGCYLVIYDDENLYTIDTSIIEYARCNGNYIYNL